MLPLPLPLPLPPVHASAVVVFTAPAAAATVVAVVDFIELLISILQHWQHFSNLVSFKIYNLLLHFVQISIEY